MARLKLFLLGQFHVTLDESPLAGLRSGKSRALLAYLAGEAGRPHQRSALATLLWGEHTNDAARLSLRVALSSLRDILLPLTSGGSNPPLLEITHQSVHLNPAHCWIDAVEFDAQLAACVAHPHQTFGEPGRAASRCPSCIQRLTQAALLYRGDFLTDLAPADSPAFDEWRVLCQERYHLQATAALEQIAQHHLHLGHFDESQRFARQLLALDPWREAAHRQLMRALALDGQRSAALAQYGLCRRTLADELGASPEFETTALWACIRDGKLERHGIANLPATLTPLMGREVELEQMAACLSDPDCRLLTLVGPGGVGKTRLALAAAAQQDGLFPDGIFFVPAPAVGAPGALDLAAAEALKLTFTNNGASPKAQLLNYLRHKEMLLVLDDLPPSGSGWAIELLRQAPQVKILATARQRLNVRGESLLRLEGLTYPASSVFFDQTDVPRETRYSAIELFVQSARRVQPNFALTAVEWPHVARICQQVDGLPLALELAAAWIPTLSCAEIASEIARDLDFLTTSLQDLPERHRSLRAVFDHSWDLLAPAERAVLARLSVFFQGFDRFSAGVVAGADLPILASLTEKALLRRERCWPSDQSPTPAAANGTGGACYSLHALVRQYAATRLAQWLGEPAATQGRHCSFFLAFVAQRREALVGTDQLQALTEMARQYENLRAAWDWGVAHHRWAELAAALPALFQFFFMRSRFHEGVALFASLAQALSDWDCQPSAGCVALPKVGIETDVLYGEALAGHAWFAFLTGQVGRAQELFERSLTRLRAASAPWALAFSLTYCGAMSLHEADIAAARAACSESLGLYQQTGDRHGMAVAHDILGRAAHRACDFDEARRQCQASLDLARALDNRWSMAYSLDLLGRIALDHADYRTAGQLFSESLTIRQEMNDRRGSGMTLNLLGDVYLACGAGAKAESCFREALSIFQVLGYQAGYHDALAGLAKVLNRAAEAVS